MLNIYVFLYKYCSVGSLLMITKILNSSIFAIGIPRNFYYLECVYLVIQTFTVDFTVDI